MPNGATWTASNFMDTTTTEPDFTVEDHGLIFLVRSNNDAAREHLSENVQDDAHWIGSALVVRHRCISDLVDGLRANGYTVK